MLHRASAVAPVLFIASFALACDRHNQAVGTPTAPTPVVAQSISISGRTSFEQIGETSQLTAMVAFSDGTTKEANVDTTWTAFPSSVISITAQGLLTTLQYGTGTVMARYRSPAVTAQANVRVLPNGTFIVTGYVNETGFGIESVRIEARSSARTVAAATNAVGYYTLLPVDGDATLRAEKDGFVAQVKRLTETGDQRLDFDLQRIDPVATVDGVYKLTIAASASCTTLPAEVMHRSYTAHIAESQGTLRVLLKDANYFWGDAELAGKRAGNSATFGMLDEFDGIFELISADSYLGYSGTAIGEITDRRIGATLDGTVYLRHLRPADGIIAQCRAVDHRLEFVR